MTKEQFKELINAAIMSDEVVSLSFKDKVESIDIYRLYRFILKDIIYRFPNYYSEVMHKQLPFYSKEYRLYCTLNNNGNGVKIWNYLWLLHLTDAVDNFYDRHYLLDKENVYKKMLKADLP